MSHSVAIIVNVVFHLCLIAEPNILIHIFKHGDDKTAIKCKYLNCYYWSHYDDVIMGTIASQITSLTIVNSTVYSDADQSKHQSSASLAFVWGIHRGPVNSPHKWPVTRKMFPFDVVIMGEIPAFATEISSTNIGFRAWISESDKHGM